MFSSHRYPVATAPNSTVLLCFPSKYLSQSEFLVCLHTYYLVTFPPDYKLHKSKNLVCFVQCCILRGFGALHSRCSINVFRANEWTSFSYNILSQRASHSTIPKQTYKHSFNNPISFLLLCSITVLKWEISWLYINHCLKVLFYNV